MTAPPRPLPKWMRRIVIDVLRDHGVRSQVAEDAVSSWEGCKPPHSCILYSWPPPPSCKCVGCTEGKVHVLLDHLARQQAESEAGPPPDGPNAVRVRTE